MQPNADAVRAQLARIVASPPFATAARMSRFLSYVVDRALAGDADRLKEYVIGVEVFDRDGRYDPRVDSIVRVEAGRLRGKLEEYYLGPGAEDPVRIHLRKGSYAPVFEQRLSLPAIAPQSAPPPKSRRWPLIGALLAALALLTMALWLFMRPVATDSGAIHPSRPAIALLPIIPYGAGATMNAEAEMLGERLTESVTAGLVRNGTFEVVPSVNTARYRNPRSTPENVAQILGARALLRGRVMLDGNQLRVEMLLMDGERNRKVWVDTFTGNIGDLDRLARRIADGSAAAAAAQIVPP